MPRSSHHKSSKHSSRDVRDYSDSEKDSSLKERRVKEESSGRALKESVAGDKRKADMKDTKELHASGNGEYLEEYASSKRRKERADNAGSRWNGGEDDIGESSKKSKASSDTKSRRKEEVEDSEPRKTSVKSEGKKESSRKEGREAVVERDRKYKEGKSERLLDNEEHRALKQASEKTELNDQDQLPSPELENQLERRVRRKRDDTGNVDRHQDISGETNDKHMLAREDISKDGKRKEEKHKDERNKDKYREDFDKDTKHRDEKKKDERPAKDRVSSRSDDKQSRNEKDVIESRHKKSKPQDSIREREPDHVRDHDRNREREYDRARDRDRERERDRERDRGRHDYERERDRDHDYDRDRDWDRERDRDWDLDKERDRDRDRNRDRDHDRDRDVDIDRDREVDRDKSYLDEPSVKYKDGRGRKRSSDDHADLSDTKPRGGRAHYIDTESRTLSSNRDETDVEREKSQLRQSHTDPSGGSNRRRASPSASSHGGADEFRHTTEQRIKSTSSREASGFSAISGRGSKYRSTEKSTKLDDGHGELSVERSLSSKASPMGLVERSPSSTSHERRYMNRGSTRRSLEVEETGRRSSASFGGREMSASEDRMGRDLLLEKPLADVSSQTDLSFGNRANQSNSSLMPPLPVYRPGVGSPSLMGSHEEDNRGIGGRYKRSGEVNMGRGQGNAWRGPPNWSSPVPNGFIPFPHGPPHGGFQGMMPQYPSPSLFGVRPSMEINQSGMPYHLPDERFPNHMRPLGWQNMMDGSGASHLHGWDVSNGVFRDESHMYGGPEWDHNRHPMHNRGWEHAADMWKGQNGDANSELPSLSLKEDFMVQTPRDDASAGQVAQSENNHLGNRAKSVERRSIVSSPAEKIHSQSPKNLELSEPSKASTVDDVTRFSSFYLSKLDISAELAGPEVHSQCMSFLDEEQCSTFGEEITMIMNLKDGGRAEPNYYNDLTSSVPAANTSIFQRAMDLYKTQRGEQTGFPITNDKKFDVLLTNTENNAISEEQQVNTHDIEMNEEEVMIQDVEILKEEEVQIPIHEQKAETFSISHVSSPNLDDAAQHSDSNTPKNMAMVGEILNSVKTEEMVDAEDAIFEDVGHDGSETCASLLIGGDNMMIEASNGIQKHFGHCSDEGEETYSGRLVLTNASPMVSRAVNPGSNGSESVILNRIHHSPESTH